LSSFRLKLSSFWLKLSSFWLKLSSFWQGRLPFPARPGDPLRGLLLLDARGVGLRRTGEAGARAVAALQDRADEREFGRLRLLLGPSAAQHHPARRGAR